MSPSSPDTAVDGSTLRTPIAGRKAQAGVAQVWIPACTAERALWLLLWVWGHQHDKLELCLQERLRAASDAGSRTVDTVISRIYQWPVAVPAQGPLWLNTQAIVFQLCSLCCSRGAKTPSSAPGSEMSPFPAVAQRRMRQTLKMSRSAHVEAVEHTGGCLPLVGLRMCVSCSVSAMQVVVRIRSLLHSEAGE